MALRAGICYCRQPPPRPDLPRLPNTPFKWLMEAMAVSEVSRIDVLWELGTQRANGHTGPSAAFLMENLIKARGFIATGVLHPCCPHRRTSPRDAVCSWSSWTDGLITVLQPVSHAGCNWRILKNSRFFSTK